MAMAWLNLDDATIDAVSALAASSWEPQDLDATWGATGWPTPGGEALSRFVFEKREFSFAAGSRMVSWTMSLAPLAITGFMVDFAIFCDVTDPADPDLASFFDWPTHAGWQVETAATQPRFDAAWRVGYAAVAHRLGTPMITGRHDSDSQHAIWRYGPRLIVAAQVKDYDALGDDAAQLCVLEHPPANAIPTGDDLYDLLVGTSAVDE